MFESIIDDTDLYEVLQYWYKSILKTKVYNIIDDLEFTLLIYELMPLVLQTEIESIYDRKQNTKKIVNLILLLYREAEKLYFANEINVRFPKKLTFNNLEKILKNDNIIIL